MKKGYKLLGIHAIALVTFLLIVLPLLVLAVFLVICGTLIGIYRHTFNFYKYIFGLDKKKWICYNVINSSKKRNL